MLSESVDNDNDGGLFYKLFFEPSALLCYRQRNMTLMLNCHWICINENKRPNFVHDFINYNMKVNYRLSTDYDQKKEICLKTYIGSILINKD